MKKPALCCAHFGDIVVFIVGSQLKNEVAFLLVARRSSAMVIKQGGYIF